MTTVDEARARYLLFGGCVLSHQATCRGCRGARPVCRTLRNWSRSADAASIVLDLAVAESVARRSVAWA